MNSHSTDQALRRKGLRRWAARVALACGAVYFAVAHYGSAGQLFLNLFGGIAVAYAFAFLGAVIERNKENS